MAMLTVAIVAAAIGDTRIKKAHAAPTVAL
jgi:hypothetical protein